MHRVTPTDFAVASALGLLLAESPFTPPSSGPSLAIGMITAAFYLWYRSTHARKSAQASLSEIARRVRSTPLTSAAVLVLFVAVHAATLIWMYARWTDGLWQNQHGLIVALLIGLLTRSALRRQSGPYDVSSWGFLPLLAGLGMTVLDAGIHSHLLASIGFVISLPGISLLLLGVTRTRALALPLVMSVFLVPIPSTVATHLFLRDVTALGTTTLLELFGIPISREHSLLSVPGGSFTISDACSGFATMTAVVALGLMLAFHCTSRSRRALLMLTLLPLALLANTLRVFVLVLLSMRFGVGILDTTLHEASGVAVFFALLAALYLLADRPSLQSALA